jgi:RNA polymerase sigma-70 factor (ECF subfamily)
VKTTAYALLLLLLAFTLAPDCTADDIVQIVSLDSFPPSVIKTVPVCGDTAVDPNLREISVTYSKDMKVTDHCWSWCGVADSSFPKLDGKTEFLQDNRTCVLHVALEPEKTYAIWMNLDKYLSFQDPHGHPAVPYLLVFRTAARESSKDR